MPTGQLVIRNGEIVTPTGVVSGDIVVRDGTISEIVPGGLADTTGMEVVDATGLIVLPGAIDGHTHFIQDDPALFGPDPDEFEGFELGGRGAAAGGVTTVIEMPQSRPPTVDGATFTRKRELAAQDAIVDFSLWGGVIQGTTDAAIDEQIALGAVGMKAFMCDSDPSFPGVNDDQLLRSLTHLAGSDVLFGVHAESDNLLQTGLARMEESGRIDPLAHADSRPPIVEIEAVSRAITLAEAADAWVHIVHLSSGEAADVVARAKARGVRVTCETCPQYLTLDHDDLQRLGPFARCAPPIRARADVERLWERLHDGTIDVITTDHCAFTKESKVRGLDNIFEAPCGLPSLDVFVPLVADEALRRGFSWADVARWTATAPAQLWQIDDRKGSIVAGRDADFALVDPTVRWTVKAADLQFQHKWTPYEGRELTGRVVKTIVRGQTVFTLGSEEFPPPGTGRFVPHSAVATSGA